MNRLLTIAQTAEALGVHASTVRRNLARLGAVDLTQGRGGKRIIRIPEDRLREYLSGCQILPPMKEVTPTRDYHIPRRRA